MQHVERSAAMLGDEDAPRSRPDRRRCRTRAQRSSERDNVSVEDRVSGCAVRVAEREHAHVVLASQYPHEIEQRGNAPVSLAGAETWDDEANAHAACSANRSKAAGPRALVCE